MVEVTNRNFGREGVNNFGTWRAWGIEDFGISKGVGGRGVKCSCHLW